MKSRYPVEAIGVIGNHLPRQCGIATFTTHLCEALETAAVSTRCMVVAMTDTEDGYAYPPVVRFELKQNDLDAYRQAADYLNVSGANVVSLQHEFGIFGGPDGSHLLSLLERLRIPIVTTLHTVLAEPTDGQYRIMKEIGMLSSRCVVMSERSVGTFSRVYDIPLSKIDVIPHGVPDLPLLNPDSSKKWMGLADRKILLTSGLLSPNKGIEYVIDAMPAILARHPEAMYVVLGTTHPHVRRDRNEEYREYLAERITQLGITDHIRFHDAFVTQDEFSDYMHAADIFVTPYNFAGQAVSGVLSEAIGAGKAIISTPYEYAREMLRDGRGILVPFRDSEAISVEAIRLLNDREKWNTVRHAAYELCRRMSWPIVAQKYLQSFQQAVSSIPQRVEAYSFTQSHLVSK